MDGHKILRLTACILLIYTIFTLFAMLQILTDRSRLRLQTPDEIALLRNSNISVNVKWILNLRFSGVLRFSAEVATAQRPFPSFLQSKREVLTCTSSR